MAGAPHPHHKLLPRTARTLLGGSVYDCLAALPTCGDISTHPHCSITTCWAAVDALPGSIRARVQLCVALARMPDDQSPGVKSNGTWWWYSTASLVAVVNSTGKWSTTCRKSDSSHVWGHGGGPDDTVSGWVHQLLRHILKMCILSGTMF